MLNEMNKTFIFSALFFLNIFSLLFNIQCNPTEICNVAASVVRAMEVVTIMT